MLLLPSYLPRPVPGHQQLCMTALFKYNASPMLSVPILCLLFPKTLFCSVIFTRLCQYSVCFVSCSLSSLPCSCNVRSSSSRVLGLPMNNRLINYTLQGRARTHEHTDTHKHVYHWSLGLQGLFHWSQVKLPTTTPPWPLCTCGGQGGNCSAERGKKKKLKLRSSIIFLCLFPPHGH